MGLRKYFQERKRKWDAICNHCGLCCFEKGVRKGRYYIDLNRACRFLDVETNNCLVYEQRFKACRECSKLRMYHALFATYLPHTCGYVQKYRFWRHLQPKTLFRGTISR